MLHLLLILLMAFSQPDAASAQALRLAPCPDTPNCVSSQAGDEAHYIAPLPGAGSRDATFARLKEVLSRNRRVKIMAEQPGYLKAEFHIPIFGFVDDAEFLWSEAERVLHVRSASRVGRGDLGVNRRRVERLRKSLSEPPRALP